MPSSQDPRNEVVEIHFQVIRVANHFVKQAARFSIEELKEHDDPTYEEIATNVKLIAGILKDVASMGVYGEERLAHNALQAANLMERMATAIEKKDEKALKDAATELGKMCPI
ncbi:hypothetical protein [Oceanobacter sp. 3_MG-2023]|uniref:hypothetical protein n=1 Tax=Oceanobacter sp. 3_MG-2023 TaxID=3062622 RepID=UPI0027324F91|nr:hypothetical protein [Oceanobacter sp. 3_MG-2023]MDP2505629.1 hypothetical protein [Oceanobacter sp. 3_MG-2023]